MKNKIDTAVAIVFLLLLLYSIHQCTGYKNAAEINAGIINDTVRHYTNKLGTQTATVNTVLLDNKTLRDEVVNKDAKLKVLTAGFAKLGSVIRYNTVTRIDTIPVTYTDSVPCIFDRDGTIENRNYSLAFKANQKGILITSLFIPDSVTLITGTKRKWFLGRETLLTDVTHSNPFVKVTQMQSANATVNIPFYKKWYVWLATGLIGGLALAK